MASTTLRVCAALFFVLAASVVAHPAPAQHHFAVAHGRFELDGKPFQVISGDMHYSAFRARTGATPSYGERHRDQHHDHVCLLEPP